MSKNIEEWERVLAAAAELQQLVPECVLVGGTATAIHAKMYDQMIRQLKAAFGNHLKTAVLFGSRARGKTAAHKDHDIFLVIEDLPADPLKRQKEIRMAIWELPIRINTIAKTPEEVDSNLTPLLLEICVDGICFYGSDYFEPYRKRAMNALNQSGLKRKRVGQEWRWQFEKIPAKEWEMTWEGFRELE